MQLDSTASRYAAIAVVVLMIIGVGFWLFGGSNGSSPDDAVGDRPPGADDSLDALEGFYAGWLTALQASNTDPYAAELYNNPYLTEEMQNRLRDSAGEATGAGGEEFLDPVLCQFETPERYRTRRVFEDDAGAQILVISRGIETPRQSLVSLTLFEDGWRISDIECKEGESGPEREFSFEREGFLLKTVPPPLNPEHWHLVFEENGQKGHTAPLFFDAESICVEKGGNETPCNPDGMFTPAAPASVQGEMSEAGVNVKRLFLNE